MAKVEINEDAVRFIAKTRELDAKVSVAKKKFLKLTEEAREAKEEFDNLQKLKTEAKELAIKHLFNDIRNN